MQKSFTSFFILLYALLALPAMAQNVDWKSFGRPLDDDTKNMRDRFVYMNDETMDKNVGVDRAVMSQPQVYDWIREKLGQAMTLEGARFNAQVTGNNVLFTPKGYAEYKAYLSEINLGKFLGDNGFKTVAYVEGEPFMTNQGLVAVAETIRPDGARIPAHRAYTWQATARLILSYLDYRNAAPAMLFKGQRPDQIKNGFPLQVNVEIIRIPQAEGGQMVAINGISFANAQ